MKDYPGFENIPAQVELSQGRQAVESGEAFRLQMESLFTNSGAGFCLEERPKTLAQFMALKPDSLFHRGIVSRDLIVGTCVYFRDLKLTFVAWRSDWPSPLGILQQSQEVSGSAEAKIAKRMLDLDKCCPIPSVMVIGGSKFEDDAGIQEFAKRYAAASDGKILHVFIGQAEFTRWAAKGFKWPVDAQTKYT